jgi:hypothetical protein
MQIVPSREPSLIKRELVELVRGPVLLATAAGLGFEAISHLFTMLFFVVLSGGVGSLAMLALRGRERYPILHRVIFSKTRRP